MDFGKLTVEYRSSTGKNEAKRLRATGRVPGICYGAGAEPVPISLSARELKKALNPEKRRNTVIQVTVTGGEGGSKELTVMLKDYQVDAIRRDVQHVDLVVIDVNKEVTVEVPLVLLGKPIGLVDGGQLHTVHRTLAVTCKPAEIPVKVEIDISHLKLGEALHVRDVKLPAGIKAAVSSGETIASVVAPRQEKSPTEEAAEAAAAAGVEAAAVPAAGAAVGAPGAAPAPAAKGDAAKAAKPKEGKK
jgi:large subunit ribosomal protein L25